MFHFFEETKEHPHYFSVWRFEIHLKAVDTSIPFKALFMLSRGKQFELNLLVPSMSRVVHHFGIFPELEDQMCN
ncbi:MAG TPA: hypothetical protein VGK06_10900 [Methanosarcina sp.]|jgi:hypothetical protein